MPVREYSKSARAVLVALFLVPLFMGMFGIGMHFIPVSSHRWIAILLAIAYTAALAFFFVRLGPTSVLPESELEPMRHKALIALLAGTYFFYVSFYITIPGLITEATGTPVKKDYVIEDLKRGGIRARLCPYNLKLQEVVSVLGDTYCVSKTFAGQHAIGETIQLSGNESSLGFRFLNIE